MNNREAPRSAQQHISIQQVGAETLVYDEQRHKAFCLNEISSVIWRLADGERAIAQISADASLEMKIAITEELVVFAIEELRRDGLIEPLSCAEVGEMVSRRDMLQRLAVGGAMLLPGVAAIVAPTAAQAYSGCFDCDSSQSVQLAKARARNQQLSAPGGLSSASAFTSASPGIGQPILIDPDLQH